MDGASDEERIARLDAALDRAFASELVPLAIEVDAAFYDALWLKRRRQCFDVALTQPHGTYFYRFQPVARVARRGVRITFLGSAAPWEVWQ